MRSGENRAGLLADALELGLDDVGARLVLAAGLQPVGQLGEKVVYLVLVVAAQRRREPGLPDLCDGVVIHGARVARYSR